jgi:hypothetical protein
MLLSPLESIYATIPIGWIYKMIPLESMHDIIPIGKNACYYPHWKECILLFPLDGYIR